MIQLNFEPFPVLETERLILRELVADDCVSLHALRSDKQVMHFIPRPLTKDAEDAGLLIEMILGKIRDKSAINWAITLKNTGEHIGMIGYVNIVRESYRAEIGYMLHPAYHRKGFIMEALNCTVKYGFNTMKLHSIAAVVNPENKASSSLLIKSGFVLEGRFRDYMYFDGRFSDAEVYGLLDKD